jgi:hypothetical protein
VGVGRLDDLGLFLPLLVSVTAFSNEFALKRVALPLVQSPDVVVDAVGQGNECVSKVCVHAIEPGI